MTSATAPASRCIKVISGLVMLLTAGFLAASVWHKVLLLPGAVLVLIVVGCYLRSPIGYGISPEGLTIRFHLGSKHFGPLTGAALVTQPLGLSLRLFGNGGLFSGTGIFWNIKWGIFRAYITASDPTKLVLVEAGSKKVLISPERPDEIIRAASSNVG
jgi:hypothetical protein